MKEKFLIVICSIIFGLFIWVLDAALDSLFFYEDTFLNLVILNIPKPELFFRLEVLVSFSIFGIIISVFFSKQKKTEAHLRRLQSELESRVEERTKLLSRAVKTLENEISKKLKAERQLMHSQKMLKGVFDGITDPLILLGSDVRVKIYNRAAKDYYGLTADKADLDLKCHQLLRDSAMPCQGCRIPVAVREGKKVRFERKGFVNPERIENVYLYPVKDAETIAWDILVRINDITEHRLLQKQVIQNEKMATLGLLISSVAHEINNPIGFVSFNLPILRDYIAELMPIVDAHAAERPEFEICNLPYPDFREDILKLLNNLEHGSARIKSFVSNLKEFSQINFKVEERWLDLDSVIERVIQINQVGQLKNVKFFERKVPKNLPKIWSDPYALEQILINLLINAAQASDKNDSSVVLRVEVLDNWLNHLILEVSDNGIGIDEKTKGKIFDPFFTTKSMPKGTGLGLYVCQGLVASLRGRIEMESQPGKGSKFRVILPDKDRRNVTRS